MPNTSAGKANGKAGGFGAKQFGAVQHHGGKASGFGAKARDALAKHGGKGGGGKLRRSNLTAAALLGGVGGGRLPKMLLSSKQAAAPLSGHVDVGKASASHPVVMTDLEAPDVFRDAARAIATDYNEFLMMATGLRRHVGADAAQRTQLDGDRRAAKTRDGPRRLVGHVLQVLPPRGVLLVEPHPPAQAVRLGRDDALLGLARRRAQFCPFFTAQFLVFTTARNSHAARNSSSHRRFKFYYIKKLYIAKAVRLGFGILQVDTDTTWVHNPLPALRAMHQSSIIVMKDLPFVNAGVIFARPGSPEAQRLLDDVAWRVQLFQNHAREVIGRLVHYAREPYYANSDDQTLLSDCFLSAILGERTWLTSTARFEARNRYNNLKALPEWPQLPEAVEQKKQVQMAWKKARNRVVSIHWGSTPGRPGTRVTTTKYPSFALGPNDSLALAPRRIFAHLPYDPSNAVTHLTAARGFQAKVRALKRIDRGIPSERVPNASKTSSALGGILDSVRTTAGSFAAKMQSTVLEGLG